jgi:hypothetical protein
LSWSASIRSYGFERQEFALKIGEKPRRSSQPLWFDHEVCGEGNAHVGIGKEIYYFSGDGLLMPAVKDQPPPDLRYFKKYDR